MKHDRDLVIDVMCATVEAMELPTIIKEGCIAMTKLGIDALRYFRLDAKPVPVKVLALNPTLGAWVQEGHTLDETAEWPEGSFAVALGHGVDPNTARQRRMRAMGRMPGWDGHLVIGVDDHVLIDLSMSQMRRNNRNIILPDTAILRVESPFEGLTESVVFDFGECVVAYDPDPTNVGYRDAPDWKLTGGGAFHRALVGQVIRAMKAILADA
jgi:hypothetical protein